MLNFITTILAAIIPQLLFMDEIKKQNLVRNLKSLFVSLKRLSSNPRVHRFTLLLTFISLLLFA